MLKASFVSPLWEFTGGKSSWFFVSVPPDDSDRIADQPREPRPGFGSLRVSATVGSTTWLTSIFPSKESGSYILPVKRAVRVAEQLNVGEDCAVSIHVLE